MLLPVLFNERVFRSVGGVAESSSVFVVPGVRVKLDVCLPAKMPSVEIEEPRRNVVVQQVSKLKGFRVKKTS